MPIHQLRLTWQIRSHSNHSYLPKKSSERKHQAPSEGLPGKLHQIFNEEIMMYTNSTRQLKMMKYCSVPSIRPALPCASPRRTLQGTHLQVTCTFLHEHTWNMTYFYMQFFHGENWAWFLYLFSTISTFSKLAIINR